MSTAPARSFTRLAIAIVIAAVVISASALSYASFESTVTRTSLSTTTLTTTCTEGVVTTPSPGSAATHFSSTTDCNLGMTLGVEANPSVGTGQNETVNLSLTNDFNEARNVSYSSVPNLPHGPDLSSVQAIDDILPALPSCGFPSTGYAPAFIVIYNGSDYPIQLSDSPPSLVSCLNVPSNHYHSFNSSQTISQSLSVGGYWTSSDVSQPWINATYHQFSPGNYTAVAFDPWGQMTQLSFTITGSSPECPQSAGQGSGSPRVLSGTSAPAIICLQLYYYSATPLDLNVSEGLSIQALQYVQNGSTDYPRAFNGESNFTVTSSPGQLVIGGQNNENEGMVIAYAITAKPTASGTYWLAFFKSASLSSFMITPQEPLSCAWYGELIAGSGQPDYTQGFNGCITFTTTTGQASGTSTSSGSGHHSIPGISYPLPDGNFYFTIVGITNSTQTAG